jgi:hypothetical protein
MTRFINKMSSQDALTNVSLLRAIAMWDGSGEFRHITEFEGVGQVSLDGDVLNIGVESDVVIASSGTTVTHDVYHGKGKFAEVIEELGTELGIAADDNGNYDLRTKVENDGVLDGDGNKTLTTSSGELTITTDGVLIIIDSRFEAGHAGRTRQAVYARDSFEAIHELSELRAWYSYAMDTLGMSQQDIHDGALNTWIKSNIQQARALDLQFHRKAVAEEWNARNAETKSTLESINGDKAAAIAWFNLEGNYTMFSGSLTKAEFIQLIQNGAVEYVYDASRAIHIIYINDSVWNATMNEAGETFKFFGQNSNGPFQEIALLPASVKDSTNADDMLAKQHELYHVEYHRTFAEQILNDGALSTEHLDCLG